MSSTRSLPIALLVLSLSVAACGTARRGGRDVDDDDDSAGDGDADTDGDVDADGDTDADTDGDVDGDGDTDVDVDVDVDVDADGDADVGPEVCNGEDDDGDGSIDEGSPGAGEFCDTGLEGICATGSTACVRGDIACEPDQDQGVETCGNPGADDDCDGRQDDVPDIGRACDTGLDGVCADGAWGCDGRQQVCAALRLPGREICGNFEDDDCDGRVDDVGCADRTEVLLCGASTRDVTPFLPLDRDLTLVDGCEPTDQTQAMLISRNGVGLYDAAGLRAYLDAGGVVLTEWNASADIFNAAFQEAVVLGGWNGACEDSPAPEMQLTPNDPFWQDNDFVAEDLSGCGYDVSLYPGITPIGAWATGDVQLAYRDRGQGRLWVLEADWQDNDAVLDANAIHLMQYMVGWTP